MKNLVSKRFRVIVSGEFERSTNFNGLLTLLHRFSDFFDYTPKEQADYWKESEKQSYCYIDANITAKIA